MPESIGEASSIKRGHSVDCMHYMRYETTSNCTAVLIAKLYRTHGRAHLTPLCQTYAVAITIRRYRIQDTNNTDKIQTSDEQKNRIKQKPCSNQN